MKNTSGESNMEDFYLYFLVYGGKISNEYKHVGGMKKCSGIHRNQGKSRLDEYQPSKVMSTLTSNDIDSKLKKKKLVIQYQILNKIQK